MTANTDHPDRPRSVFRPIRPRGVIAGLVFLGTLVLPCFGQPSEDPHPQTLSNEPATLVERLSSDEHDASSEIGRRLRDPESAESTLAAIAVADRLPLSLWRDVSVLTGSVHPPEIRVLATEAVARFGSRESIKLLITLTGDDDQAVRSQALHALPELTGFGDTWGAGAWAAWGEEADRWTDRIWNRFLLTAHAERRRASVRAMQVLRDEQVALYRRLHVELDAGGRSTLISELIRDERAWLRDLGFDLAGRDLSARTSLGEGVARAAASRLSHPDATTRARAANLVSRLVPPDAMILLTDALAVEQDPRAAEPILLGVARWPNAEAVAPLLVWLERSDAPTDAVTTALWAHVAGGHINEPAERDRALGALRGLPLERIGEPGMRALLTLGSAEDLERITASVSTPESATRESAAEALTETAGGTERLFELAGRDARLFGTAAKGLGRHQRTPAGLRRLAGLPALDDAERSRAIVLFSELLDPSVLAPAVLDADLGDELTARTLARLTEPGLDPTPGVADGLIELTRARLRLGRTDAALESAVLLDGVALPEQTAARLRRTNLWLHCLRDDLEAAGAVADTSAEDWLDAFGRLDAEAPAKPGAARVILDRFGDALDEETRAEVAAWIPPKPPDEEAAPLENAENADEPGVEPEPDTPPG